MEKSNKISIGYGSGDDIVRAGFDVPKSHSMEVDLEIVKKYVSDEACTINLNAFIDVVNLTAFYFCSTANAVLEFHGSSGHQELEATAGRPILWYEGLGKFPVDGEEGDAKELRLRFKNQDAFSISIRASMYTDSQVGYAEDENEESE